MEKSFNDETALYYYTSKHPISVAIQEMQSQHELLAMLYKEPIPSKKEKDQFAIGFIRGAHWLKCMITTMATLSPGLNEMAIKTFLQKIEREMNSLEDQAKVKLKEKGFDPKEPK